MSVSKYVFNILVVFILSGLWHGANWTFIVWGLLHGMFLLFEYFRRKRFPGFILPGFVHIIFTFLLVSFAWIFFRASNIDEAFVVLKRIFNPHTAGFISGEFDGRALLVYSALGLIVVAGNDIISEYFPGRMQFLHNPGTGIRITTCVCLVLIIMLFGVFDGSQFIYFQF